MRTCTQYIPARVYASAHTHTYIHTHVRSHARTCTHKTHTRTLTHMRTHMHARTHTHKTHALSHIYSKCTHMFMNKLDQTRTQMYARNAHRAVCLPACVTNFGYRRRICRASRLESACEARPGPSPAKPTMCILYHA